MDIKDIKLVIWDLDETIWDGSLVEDGKVQPRQNIINIIKDLDRIGIINSICSKNNYNETKEYLKELGIWDLFVFPVIDFTPKGMAIKSIIESTQLRSANVLFVDDNIGNINEAKFYCEGILTGDANDIELVKLLSSSRNIEGNNSRLNQYKILEEKASKRKNFSENTEFLKSSNITVCVVRNPNDLIFKERIIELANRSNQLNYTKSRFTYDSFEREFSETRSMYLHHGAIFVYDDFGYYGLVGFYSFDERRDHRTLDHYFFSCRILNMDVTNAVYYYLRKIFKLRQFDQLEKTLSDDYSYINIKIGLDDKMSELLKGDSLVHDSYTTIVSAKCESGIIGHYLSENLRPIFYDIIEVGFSPEIKAKYLIYSIFNDYNKHAWKDRGGFSDSRFVEYLKSFSSQFDRYEKIFIILSSELGYNSALNGISIVSKFRIHLANYIYGTTDRHFKLCNKRVREVLSGNEKVEIIDIGEFVQSEEEQFDKSHFDRIVFKRLCDLINRKLANNI